MKVVEVGGHVYKPENLLKGNFMEQNMFDFPDFWEFNGKGYIILDFGREYFGGVRLFFHSNGYSSLKPYLHIRCKIPTVKGIVEIELTQKEEGVETKLHVPDGLTQVK